MLDRQIGMLYYERLLLTQDRAAVGQEAASNLNANNQPRGNGAVSSRRITPISRS